MTTVLLTISLIILACVLLNRVTDKVGVRTESLIPVGNTVLAAGDRVVISGLAYQEQKGIQLMERTIGKRDCWVGRPLAECSRDPQELVVMIRRGEEPVIPRGDTVLQAGDVLVIHSREKL